MNEILAVLEDDSLSRMELMVLFLLKKKEYKVTSLAKDVGIPASTLTGMIDRLMERDYVKRYRSTEDRRVVLIGLNYEIKDKLEESNKIIDNLIEVTEKDLPESWWRDLNDKLDVMEDILVKMEDERQSK